MHLVLRSVLVGALVAVMAAPLSAAQPPAGNGLALLDKAKAAQHAKQFDKALDFYLRSYLAGQKSTEVRDQIHDCLRQVAQTKRHRDSAFRQYVLSLTVSESLNLYAEIVRKLSTHHADKDKATPEKLFAMSLVEIERALADKQFRKQNLPMTSDTKLAKFVKSLQEEWPQRLPSSPREARAALQELLRNALSELHYAEPASLVLEAICGACGGLDESTAYVPPTGETAATQEPTIMRAEITDPMTGVGTIAIGRFRDGTPAEFEQALQQLKMAGLRALVIDLRGNPGGSFVAAIRLAERFVPQGVLVTTFGQVPEFDGHVFSSASGMTALELPLVVLVDGKTMSAAEVFAVAVKESGRATLIGMNTFGKGSVQSPVSLEGDSTRGTLMVTIARVISRNGVPLHGAGVEPHVNESQPTLQMRLATQRAAELADTMR